MVLWKCENVSKSEWGWRPFCRINLWFPRQMTCESRETICISHKTSCSSPIASRMAMSIIIELVEKEQSAMKDCWRNRMQEMARQDHLWKSNQRRNGMNSRVLLYIHLEMGIERKRKGVLMKSVLLHRCRKKVIEVHMGCFSRRREIDACSTSRYWRGG